MKNNPFSFFLDQLEQKLPESLRPVRDEIKSAARAMMDDKLARLDWVPRSEFEAQVRLLEQAEARIAALEAQLDAKKLL
ncbi:MAG: accessory factor UbiK family protein [Cardiobacteriaceae bacterium]|nr:accessory factor UbiK family protein [Cardiobacteriaceae bacterium]